MTAPAGSVIDPATRSRLASRAAAASMLVAVLLVSLKTWAAWRTDSAAMLGSLADSALDLVASLATLVGVLVAARPADEDHRFGHGKAEGVAAMVQVVLIALSAAAIAWRALAQWLEGARVATAGEGVLVSVLAILATFALLAWQRYVIARTGSVAITADNVHYQSDLLLNLAVIAALLLDRFADIAWADPLFGLAIAAWLAWGAWRAAHAALALLLDREWPEARRRAFVERAARHPELARLHDLRTRSTGTHDIAQFHVDLPATMTVGEAHTIIARVEADLAAAFPGTEILIHIDPAGHIDDPGNELVETSEFARLAENLPKDRT
jgi:ferrous-iron efflux pump FieF